MHLIKGPYVLVYFSLHASFHISFFQWTWSFSMSFSIMTSPRYNDVTHFSTDLNENCTAYVKLKIKDILFGKIFWFSKYLLRKLRLITKITSIVQLPYTSPPSPLGHPLGWVLLGTHLWHAWRYFFNTKNKNKNNNSFYLNWWKPGSIPITPPPLWPPIRGVLVLVAP